MTAGTTQRHFHHFHERVNFSAVLISRPGLTPVLRSGVFGHTCGILLWVPEKGASQKAFRAQIKLGGMISLSLLSCPPTGAAL